ncbi:MAG: carboxypeptidase regulatory-like domain-containing protein [Methanophagales archaeon]|nr:carboxypeptidase regulatory-like domain-containing protein [Methanophagales archaeon]
MNISRDTFDKLKHYVGVRLQQGVPLVDADWNEQEDIRRYELQAFLKWFVGNGVPKGNDGFCILSVTDDDETGNDFIIKGGDDKGAGRCLVEGWDVINESDLKYTKQPLYKNDDLAGKWDVRAVQPIKPPTSGTCTDTVYLDVWEREVDADEDGDLVNSAIGIETCVRRKREWVVRVEEKPIVIELPTPSDGHVYYPLAMLTRESGKDRIEADDITDLRSTNVHLASAPSTTGVVVFPDSTDSVQNISDLIDPGLGPGAISVRLGLDYNSTKDLIFVGHSQASAIFGLEDHVLLGALIKQKSGKFQVGIKVPNPVASSIRVRWWAFKPEQDIGEVIIPSEIRVTINPAEEVTLDPGEKQQYSTTVTGTDNREVEWSVNDIVWGNNTVGTISQIGLYKAPGTVPDQNQVTVKVTSVADRTKSASAFVTVRAATGSIAGKVTDIEGEVILDVEVFAAGILVSTNEIGDYVISGLPEGRYQIKARKHGYLSSETRVLVTAGQTTEQNFTLELAT